MHQPESAGLFMILLPRQAAASEGLSVFIAVSYASRRLAALPCLLGGGVGFYNLRIIHAAAAMGILECSRLFFRLVVTLRARRFTNRGSSVFHSLLSDPLDRCVLN